MQQLRAPAFWGAVGLMGLLVACSDGATVLDASPPGSADAAPEPSPLSDWASDGDAALVFEEEQVHTYELTLSEEAWADLKAHAIEEQYTPATLSVAGELVGEVGLRFKGSSGTLRRCVSNGTLTCPKLSMKLKFDEVEPTRRFFGLKRLNFNSMFSDASHLHERLAYRLFREMGVVAPRAGHARLVVNGESLGLFSLVEAIDGRFTDDHFEGGDGNLYKEQWPDTTNPETLSQRLETNEEAPDHGAMIQLREALVAAAPEELPAVVERFMDLDDLLAYIAVDHTVTNWDGMTAFYCPGGGGCRNHNYYFYQHEGQARFSLIPWDLDNTFKLYNNFDYVPSPLEVPSDCGQRYPVFGGLSVRAPGCDPLLQGVARTDPARYRAQLTRLLEGPFDQQKLQAWLDVRVAELAPLVAEDSRGPGLAAFEREVEALRRDLQLLTLRLRAERDGEVVVRTRLDPSALNDFESATPIGVKFGVSAVSAPDTQFQIALGAAETVLGGQRDLELGFEFRDAREPTSQWLRYTLPFNRTVPVDLNQKSRLRLVLQADAPRRVRISVLSSNYTEVPSGTSASFGWDVALDGSRQVIELELASASMPESGAGLPDVLSDVLAYGAALLIDPAVKGVNAEGYLGAGVSDRGSLRLDEIQFLP
jgi:hypothetical protein